MKLVTNKKTGEKYCLHCGKYDCICLPEGSEYFKKEFSTKLDVKIISQGVDEDRIYFYGQELPNGRIIKPNTMLSVPTFKWRVGAYDKRKTIYLSNDIINKSFY